MKFLCWSEMCQITKDCNCKSDCCQGYTIHPLVITYLSDNDVLTNNDGFKDEQISTDMIEDLVYHHMCPFCSGFVEC